MAELKFGITGTWKVVPSVMHDNLEGVLNDLDRDGYQVVTVLACPPEIKRATVVAVKPRKPAPKLKDIRVDSVSLVNIPRCKACGRPMAPASETQWQCFDSDCTSFMAPVHTGVYPMKTPDKGGV